MTNQQAIVHLENIKWLKGYDNTSVGGVPLADIIDDIIGLLREQKPVVFCGDCKFRQSRVSRIIDDKECNLCEMVKGYKPADWYCADGERR